MLTKFKQDKAAVVHHSSAASLSSKRDGHQAIKCNETMRKSHAHNSGNEPAHSGLLAGSDLERGARVNTTRGSRGC
jgi:hypothetical protein